MRTELRIVIFFSIAFSAFSSFAGGWGNLRGEPGCETRVVDCRTSFSKEGDGQFLYDGGDLYCTSRWIPGLVTSTETVKDGWAYTWRFRVGFPQGAKSQEIHFADSCFLSAGLNCGDLTWTWNRGVPGSRWPKRLAGGNLKVRQEVERKFWWPDDLSAIMDRYNCQPAPVDFSSTTYELTLECRGKTVYVRQQGILTGAFDVDEKFYETAPVLHLQAGIRFRGLTKHKLPTEFGAFETVDMSLQLNSRGIDGRYLVSKSAPPRGQRFHLDGIPFVWNAKWTDGAPDNVDVGESWFFQHRLDLSGYEWFEGKRWPEAGVRFPGRLVFSVPNDEYESLYVLAASDSSRANSIDTFTVQFFGSAQTGQPKNFKSPSIPSFNTKTVNAKRVCEVPLENGRNGYIHLVEIPLDFTRWREFSDSRVLNFELTKDVIPWRLWPDPCYASVNGAGLPSRVHVFAMTLKRTDLPMSFEPTQLAGLFVEGERIGYNVKFSNSTGRPVNVSGSLEGTSLDKSEHKAVPFSIPLEAGEEKVTCLEIPIERYGHYDVRLTWSKGPKTRNYTYNRTLSHIRKRPHDSRDMTTRGFMFGFWPWFNDLDNRFGYHRTAHPFDQLELAGRLGLETLGAGPQLKLPFGTNETIVAICKKYGIRNYMSHTFKYNEFGQQPGPDGIRRLEGNSLEKFNSCADGSTMLPKTEVQDPRIQLFFAEPGGIGTEGVPASLYGEQDEPMTEGQSNEFYRLWFSVKCYIDALDEYEKKSGIHQVKLLPWGDPAFGVPFLDKRPEAEFNEIDGTAFDAPLFGRLPEAQLSQNCSMFRAWFFNQAFERRHPGKKPWNISNEGPFIAPYRESYATDETARAAKAVRMMLMLGANGVPRQWSCCEITDPGDYWGEEQYGGSGLFGRVPEMNPHVSCSAYATVIRHLRDMEFSGWDNLPTRTVYSLRFRNWKTGELLRVMWCLKGTRPVSIAGCIKVFDGMDNESLEFIVQSSESNPERQTLVLTQMPVFVYGTDEKTEIILGDADNSDSKLSEHVVKLGSASELLSVKKGVFSSVNDDKDYLDVFRMMYRKFPAEFIVEKTESGLSVAMADPAKEKDRGVMPYYKTLYCDVKIPGVPSMLSMNVKAGGDWGRVVYELEDAKGEKWISNGQKDAWNVDDQDARSYFVHDGWRLLRFGLPGNYPYDLARKLSSTWWGCTGGDGIVDYPLTLKKIFVERRPKTLYVNSLEPVPNFGAVVLGDLYAEYESAGDMDVSAVEKSRLRMEIGEFEMSDSYGKLKATGSLPSTKLISVEHPVIQDRDGQKGIFTFTEMECAARYDLYLSLDPDGRGAVKVKSLKKSGERVDGLKANRDCYAFIVWYDKQGKQSLPSPIFKYALQDLFSNK